ncbi:MAG TPA: phosphoribosylamine--glycine ligase [Anaerolineales bacterium]
MNILIIGSGGREHAIAWKLAQSPKLKKLYAMPGNPGIAQFAEIVTTISVSDHPAIIQLCRELKIDLVIVGPETPLADGVADALEAADIRCFGPQQAAAQIEASKVFAKDFMERHGIPTARYATFDNLSNALAHLERLDYPVVIKASGLAAGKGVIIPETTDVARRALVEIMEKRAFGDAGSEVVIEELLTGPEVSLMAFTDGKTVVPMVAAQDHKRLLDGDQGPNTGGMGAYAPTPIFTPALLNTAVENVLKPAINGLRQEGKPFVGVLYAGLMLTPAGLRVLEFNCRFGDPETQVVLPLLESDLVEIAEACVEGHLADIEISWKKGAAVCVVLAAHGYPEKAETGKPIRFALLPEATACFQAGTKTSDEGQVVTAGGRVLGVSAWAESLQAAVQTAYGLIGQIRFEGMQCRGDIAWRALQTEARTELATGKRISGPEAVSPGRSAYANSGVSIDAGNRAVELMKSAVQATYNDSVLAGIGSFGGVFDASALKKMKHPVLVASTDGVGTKVKLAALAGRYRGVGYDIVNHCINDILVQGARPLFFMDYFATSRLNPDQTAEVVTGIAEACCEAGMALLGGETAEMPGVYAPNEFDIAGTIVGTLEQDQILPQISALKTGDVLVGLRSSGPHTNGYSLIRKVFTDIPLDTVYPELGVPLADVLLAPHRSYLNQIQPVLPIIKALAHLTGGAFIENIPRVLPSHLDAVIRLNSWSVPPLWELIRQKGDIATNEMYRVFNMGIGMVAIVGNDSVVEFQKRITEETFIIGELVAGQRKVRLVE